MGGSNAYKVGSFRADEYKVTIYCDGGCTQIQVWENEEGEHLDTNLLIDREHLGQFIDALLDAQRLCNEWPKGFRRSEYNATEAYGMNRTDEWPKPRGVAEGR